MGLFNFGVSKRSENVEQVLLKLKEVEIREKAVKREKEQLKLELKTLLEKGFDLTKCIDFETAKVFYKDVESVRLDSKRLKTYDRDVWDKYSYITKTQPLKVSFR